MNLWTRIKYCINYERMNSKQNDHTWVSGQRLKTGAAFLGARIPPLLPLPCAAPAQQGRVGRTGSALQRRRQQQPQGPAPPAGVAMAIGCCQVASSREEAGNRQGLKIKMSGLLGARV